MLEALSTFLSGHPALAAWLGALSVVMFVGGILLAPLLVIRLPADFFVRTRPPSRSWAGRHPLGRFLLRAAKNLLGALLVLLGLAMLVLPGQGVIAILMGIGLLDFPGKRHLELWLIRRPTIGKLLNGIRARAGRPPFEVPPRSGEADAPVSSPGGPAASAPEEEGSP